MEIFGYECNYSFDPNKRKSNRNVLRGELITMVVSVRRGPRGGFFFRPDGGYWIAGRRNESDPRKMLYADLLFSAAVLFFLLLLFFWHSKKVTLLREVGTDFIIFLQVKEFLWINELLEHTQEREHFEKWGFFLCCRSEPSFLFIKREDRLRTPHSSDVSHAELCVSRQWCVTSLSLFLTAVMMVY